MPCLPQLPPTLTWQLQEFLQLCFQPADLLTQLDVVHPAETQTEPLRGKTEVQKPQSNTQPVPVLGIPNFPAFPLEMPAHCIPEFC